MSKPWPVHWLDRIDSTNEEAKRRASVAAFQNQWITAKCQTAGRGRMGREWASPEGNLYATALFTWEQPIAHMTRIPFAAALAVADTITAFAPEAEPKLKWPNDVRINGAKVSGILVESGETLGTRWVALGVGINVGFVPEGLGQAGTSIADLRGDETVTTQAVLEELCTSIATRLGDAITGFESTRQAWLARAEGLGKQVRVMVNGAPVEGVFEDMAEDGALLLHLPDGGVHSIRAGDVELIKEVGLQ